MSYVGYIVEEMMHGRQQDTERLARTYQQRHAARARRRSRRSVRATRVESAARGAAATC
jgi:hypothetical protein